MLKLSSWLVYTGDEYVCVIILRYAKTWLFIVIIVNASLSLFVECL